jgi:hypothetical protein
VPIDDGHASQDTDADEPTGGSRAARKYVCTDVDMLNTTSRSSNVLPGGEHLLRTESSSSFGSEHDEIYDMLSNLPPVHRDKPAPALHSEAAAARLAPVDRGPFWAPPDDDGGVGWDVTEDAPASAFERDTWGNAADVNAMCSGLAGLTTATGEGNQPAAPIASSQHAVLRPDEYFWDDGAVGSFGEDAWGGALPRSGAPDESQRGVLQGGQTATDEEDAPAAAPMQTQQDDFWSEAAGFDDEWAQPAFTGELVVIADQRDGDTPDAGMFALMGGLKDADVSPAMRIDADSSRPVATGNNAPAVQGNQSLHSEAAAARLAPVDRGAFWAPPDDDGGFGWDVTEDAPASAFERDAATNDKLWGASHTDPTQGW